MEISRIYHGNSSSVIVEATAEGTMYNGCYNDIRLSIDYNTTIQILHVVQEHRYNARRGFHNVQEAMEPVLNEALIDYESRLRLKAVKIKLSFPQQIVEDNEHVRDAPWGSPRSPSASHRSQAPPRN